MASRIETEVWVRPPGLMHDAGRLLGAGLVDPVDQLALVVRLAEFDREAVRLRVLAAQRFDVLSVARP